MYGGFFYAKNDKIFTRYRSSLYVFNRRRMQKTERKRDDNHRRKL